MRTVDLKVFALEIEGKFKQEDELFARKLEIERLHYTEKYIRFSPKVKNLIVQNRGSFETALFDYVIKNEDDKEREKIFTGICIQFDGDSFRPITFSKNKALDFIHLTRVKLKKLPSWLPESVYVFVEGQYQEAYNAMLQNSDQFGKIVRHPDFVALYCREQYVTCYFANRYSTDKGSLAEIQDRIQHLIEVRKPLNQIKLIVVRKPLNQIKLIVVRKSRSARHRKSPFNPLD